MGDLMRKYGLYIGGGLLLLAIVILLVQLRGGSSGGPVGDAGKAFFVDEETGEQSVGAATDVPPLNNKAGKPTLVKGVFVTADGGSTKRLAYLMKYTPEAKAAIEKAHQEKKLEDVMTSDLVSEGTLVRLPDKGAPWVKMSSREGAAIDEKAFKLEGGKYATLVHP